MMYPSRAIFATLLLGTVASEASIVSDAKAMEVLLAESASGLTRSSPFPSTQHHVQSMPRLPARQLQNDEGLSAVAYHCDENNDEERSDRPLEIGSAVRICIETGRPAKIRDIYILKINTFRFLKQNADGTTVVQEAIDNGVASDNGSTNIGNACDRGVEICAFTTKLKNDFFDSDGTVKGIGSVALQIGKGDDRRELEVALRGRRKMQDFAGMVGVDMSFATHAIRQIHRQGTLARQPNTHAGLVHCCLFDSPPSYLLLLCWPHPVA
jgi:hypothetical protein